MTRQQIRTLRLGQHPRRQNPRIPTALDQHRGRPACPNPNDTSTDRNHRSHWASSPGRYSVRDAGSACVNNGLSCWTRSKNTVFPRCQVVVGADGRATPPALLEQIAARIAGANQAHVHARAAEGVTWPLEEFLAKPRPLAVIS